MTIKPKPGDTPPGRFTPRNDAKRKRAEITFCARCNQPKKRPVETYCSLQCQKNFQQEQYIEQWFASEVEGIKADGVLSGYVRRHMLTEMNHQCSKCSWSEINPATGKVPLEIDHIDGDHRNNRPENLQVLCPNCHALTPTYRALNKGNGRPGRYK